MTEGPTRDGRWPAVDRRIIGGDLLAGITLGLLLVPQSMAYAQLAGLPPVHGLYAALLPVVVGALAGWCHQLQTGPVALTAIVVAGTLAPLAEAGSAAYVGLAAVLALLVGVIRILLGLLHAADLTRLVSHPVIAGFTAAAALVIAATQLPALTGGGRGTAASPVVAAVAAIPTAAPATLAMGLGCLVALLLLRRWPRWPGALLVMAGATGIAAFGWYPGAVVGPIPAGLPSLVLPAFDWATVQALVPGALLVTVIGFAEVLSVTRSAALRTGQRPDLDRELVGQGAAALAAGATGGFPPSGSISRSSLALTLGARTALAAVVSGVVVAVVLLGGTGLLAPLPLASLAALVVAAVLPLLDPRPLWRAWRAHPHDGAAAVITVAATLLTAPHLEIGFAIGTATAIGLFLWRLTRPGVADCARHPDGSWRDWRRMALTPSAEVAVLRPDMRLCFTSAAAIEAAVHRAVAERPALRAIVFACEGVNEIDATGCETLAALLGALRDRGVMIAIAGLKTPVEQAAERADALAGCPATDRFRTTDAAVAALRVRLCLEPQPWDAPG
ncbi:MAG: hypothetical protein RLZZ127_2147 [Planctomycetota bacterium]|jgi:SulP family sulfate permease